MENPQDAVHEVKGRGSLASWLVLVVGVATLAGFLLVPALLLLFR